MNRLGNSGSTVDGTSTKRNLLDHGGGKIYCIDLCHPEDDRAADTPKKRINKSSPAETKVGEPYDQKTSHNAVISHAPCMARVCLPLEGENTLQTNTMLHDWTVVMDGLRPP